MASSEGAAASPRAGFVGPGDRGRPMAERLLATGLETTLFDVVEAHVRELAGHGAKPGTSPRDRAMASQIMARVYGVDDPQRR